MNKNEKECLINKLNKINEKIINEESALRDFIKMKKDKDLEEWCEIELTLLNNTKTMIENALINDFLEEL